jgi:hypothetical protein
MRSEAVLFFIRLGGSFCWQLLSIAANMPGDRDGCPQQCAQTRNKDSKQPAHA